MIDHIFRIFFEKSGQLYLGGIGRSENVEGIRRRILGIRLFVLLDFILKQLSHINIS